MKERRFDLWTPTSERRRRFAHTHTLFGSFLKYVYIIVVHTNTIMGPVCRSHFLCCVGIYFSTRVQYCFCSFLLAQNLPQLLEIRRAD